MSFKSFDEKFGQDKKRFRQFGAAIVAFEVIVIGVMIWLLISFCGQVKKDGIKKMIDKAWNGPETKQTQDGEQ